MTRPARLGDLDALVALERASFRGDRIARRSFRRALAVRNAAVIVETARGSLRGYALVFLRAGSRVARLYSIAVDGAARGRGVGRRLLAEAERAARRRGRDVLRLEVRRDNSASLGLFVGAGYRQFGEIPDYYEDGMTALRFEKALGRARAARGGVCGRRAPGTARETVAPAARAVRRRKTA
jgi:ribosomal protein S18 acetylase RimI-like enzyme